MKSFQGPFDVGTFPEKLKATSVTPETAPHLEGYPLLTDLAHHKSFTETVWLALKGELPTPNEIWAFEQALYWLSPIHIGEAPTHASVITRICDSWSSASLAVGAVGLSERARTLYQEYADWIQYLQGSSNQEIPTIALSPHKDHQLIEARERLFSEYIRRFGKNELYNSKLNYRREAVALLLLNQIGMLNQLIVEFLSVWACFPLVVAELKNVKPSDFFSYPARLPEIHYVESNAL